MKKNRNNTPKWQWHILQNYVHVKVFSSCFVFPHAHAPHWSAANLRSLAVVKYIQISISSGSLWEALAGPPAAGVCWRDYLTRRQQLSLLGCSSQLPSDKRDGPTLYMASWAQQDSFLFLRPLLLLSTVSDSWGGAHFWINNCWYDFCQLNYSPCHFFTSVLLKVFVLHPWLVGSVWAVSRLSGRPQRPFRHPDAFKPFHTQ